MPKKDSELMQKVKSLKTVKNKIATINKAAQNKQEEFELMLMDIKEEFGCNDKRLTELGWIVADNFGISITPEIFADEIQHILADKNIADYIDDMKSKLPNAEELVELVKVLNANKLSGN